MCLQPSFFFITVLTAHSTGAGHEVSETEGTISAHTLRLISRTGKMVRRNRSGVLCNPRSMTDDGV